MKAKLAVTQAAAAASPASAALRSRTRVLGTNEYRNVKPPVTITSGPSWPAVATNSPNGGCACSHTSSGRVAIEATSASAAAIRIGLTISTDRYSLKRRARLRGRSTCQRWLNESSTFCTTEITVQSSTARPTEPSTPPCRWSTKPITRAVSSGPRLPSGRKNSAISGSNSRWKPKALTIEKQNASSGTIDSSVV